MGSHGWRATRVSILERQTMQSSQGKSSESTRLRFGSAPQSNRHAQPANVLLSKKRRRLYRTDRGKAYVGDWARLLAGQLGAGATAHVLRLFTSLPFRAQSQEDVRIL
jgi:hypothetical protein